MDELDTASAVRELQLVQERRNLLGEREKLLEPSDITALEAAFVDVARSFSERRGIKWASWRDVGVPTAVLARANLSR